MCRPTNVTEDVTVYSTLKVTVAALMLPFSSRATWTIIVAIALLPGAARIGISFSGSIRARNTTLSCASANTRGAAIMQNKTTTHSLLIDFLRVYCVGVGEGRSLAGDYANCTSFD